MPEIDESTAAYAGLNALPDELFPRICPNCQKQYGNLDDFVSRTSPIFHNSGLMESQDPFHGTSILLMRNCNCGDTLALRCDDRRDDTEKGAFRRRRFETMVALLVEAGVQSDTARVELRRMLHV